MNLGKGFIVTVPNQDSEEKILALLKERSENYLIVLRDPKARTWPRGSWPREHTYPADWLISSMDGAFLTLKNGTRRIEGLCLIIRAATVEDLKRLLPID